MISGEVFAGENQGHKIILSNMLRKYVCQGVVGGGLIEDKGNHCLNVRDDDFSCVKLSTLLGRGQLCYLTFILVGLFFSCMFSDDGGLSRGRGDDSVRLGSCQMEIGRWWSWSCWVA